MGGRGWRIIGKCAPVWPAVSTAPSAAIAGTLSCTLTAPLVGEGVVYASVDLNEIVLRKVAMDFAGHDNRADLFEFRVRTEGLPPD